MFSPFHLWKLICMVIFVPIAYPQTPSLDEILLKAYKSNDSSGYYFNLAKGYISQKSDSANYLYFKFYKNYKDQKTDSSLYYANRVIPLLKDLDSLNRLRKIYSELHYIYLNKGRLEQALKYCQQALALAEKKKDTAMISLHQADISNIYHAFEDYEKGVLYGKRAFKTMKAAKVPNYKYLIFANNIIAINFDDWQKPDSALAYHYKNIPLIAKTEDSTRYSFVYNNLANTLLKQQKFSEAKKFQLRALSIDELTGKDYFLAADYTNLATIAYRENDYALAEKYFVAAVKHAQLSQNIEKIRDVTQQQAWYYKKTGNYKKALELQEQFYVLRDSVFNEKRAENMAEMEVKYETEKKEKDLAETRAGLAESKLEVEQKNIFIYGLAALVIILGLLAYLLYTQHKLKTRQLQKESELKTALAKIETQNQLQEQRLRISRDLHDNIGSQLTFIISSIDNLKFGLREAGTSVNDKLAKISEFTSQTIYELRDTIWAMNKTDISVEDLQARISNFIEKAKIASDVEFQFIIDHKLLKESHFNSVQGMNIYRIIQESVNNALKYSEASLIKVQISKSAATGDERFIVAVFDDGKGFNPEGLVFGNGMANIKKRAKDLGGSVDISSEEGKGTSVQLAF